MNFVLIVLAVVFIFVFATLKIFMRSYRTPRRRHRKTPAGANIPFQEVRFRTQKGCRLYGWWIPASDQLDTMAPLVILTYGWGQNVGHMLPYIQQLHPHGFHLLVFDARSHGSSDSDGYANMLKFAEDLQAAIAFARKNFESQIEWIGLLGFSIGGAASIYAAAHEQQIKRLVTIGAFSHPANIMKLEFRKKNTPYFPIVWLLFKYIQFRIGATFNQIAPLNNIRKVNAELLIIHGEKDTVVPPEEALKLIEKADPRQSKLWVINEAGHHDYQKQPNFWKNLVRFLKTGTFVSAKISEKDTHPVI